MRGRRNKKNLLPFILSRKLFSSLHVQVLEDWIGICNVKIGSASFTSYAHDCTLIDKSIQKGKQKKEQN